MSNLTTHEIAKFRLLKNMAIVLLVMFRLDRAVGPVELSEILEMHRHTVSKHLNSALSLGLITRPHFRDGYMLTIEGRQLLLGVDNSVGNVDKFLPNVEILPPMSKLSTLGPTTTALINDNMNKKGEAEADPERRKNRHWDSNVQALKAAGVGEPSRSTLADMDHVTPEYIGALAADNKMQGKPIGMLVHRIRSEDPAPAGKKSWLPEGWHECASCGAMIPQDEGDICTDCEND